MAVKYNLSALFLNRLYLINIINLTQKTNLMKHINIFQRTLSALVLLMVSSLSWAYDFEAKNADGVAIYYNLINDGTEAEVTYSTNVWTASYFDEVNIPETVEYNGKTLSVKSIGESAFMRCSNLTSVTIPESVNSIGNDAFWNCSSLTSITIPEGVTSIGKDAIGNCSSLTSVTIPSSVTSIGNLAFAGCSGLTSITVDKSNPTYDSRENCNAIIETASNTLIWGCQNTVIPESVTSIGEYAFSDRSGLTSVIIPKGVTNIDYGAFQGCSGLTSITVDKGNPAYDSRNNCNAIIETASNTLISGCQNTVIPEGVASIGGYAFSYCSGLTSITIPEGVMSIGDGAFRNCSGLTSVTIPGSVTSIGHMAFLYCSGLTSVTISEGVTSIGSFAFQYCSSLTSVTIPNSMTRIDTGAFQDCGSLTSVYSLIENPFSMWAFYYIAKDATLYVPQGTKDAYKSAGWTSFFSNVIEFDATGIAATSQDKATRAPYYTLDGKPAATPTRKGIYVKDGKKVMVK